MTNKGWSADRARLLVYQVLDHLAEHQQDALAPQPSTIAAALDSPEPLVEEAAHMLEQRGDAKIVRAINGAMRIRVTKTGMGTLTEWHIRARDHRARRQACREALLDWLYANDGIHPEPELQGFSENARAFFYGSPFSHEEVQAAAQYLWDKDLVSSGERGYDWKALEISEQGRVCVERFDGDVYEYQKSREVGPVPTDTNPSVHISANTVNYAHSSHGVRQDAMTTEFSPPKQDEPARQNRTTIIVAVIGAVALIAAALVTALIH